MDKVTAIPLPDANRLTKWFKSQLPFYHFTQDGMIAEIPSHLRHATNFTKYGQRNYNSQKTVRSAKIEDVIIRQSEDNI